MIYTDVYINEVANLIAKTDFEIYVYINEVANLIAKTNFKRCVYKIGREFDF